MNDAELMTTSPTVEGLRVEGLPKENPSIWTVYIHNQYAGLISKTCSLFRPFRVLTTNDCHRFTSYSEALGWIIKQHEETNS